jgi:preprotein translocase subunit Sec61beta
MTGEKRKRNNLIDPGLVIVVGLVLTAMIIIIIGASLT